MDDIPDEALEVDYGSWGQLFLEHAVTAERVLAGVNVMADRPIDVGPISVGPGRLAKVHAKGRIGMATCARVSTTPQIAFDVALPVSLHFVLDLTMDKQRYDAELVVPLRLTTHANADLSIVLDIAPPQPDAIQLDLRAKGLRATFTQAAAGIDGELRRFVARYVAREVAQPHILQARTVDVAEALRSAANRAVPREATP